MTNTTYTAGRHSFNINNIKGVTIESSTQSFVISFKDDVEDIGLDTFSGLEVLNLWNDLIRNKITGVMDETL